MSAELALVDDRINLALIQGDLSRLSPNEKRDYYLATCKSLGLNPLTKPFEYLRLNGKEVFYATKNCGEQLRAIHRVSTKIVAREVTEGCYVVTACASMPTGIGPREDESIGAVPIEGLKGEARANAMMKSETKAKRRVTLSICGLGMLDESEVDSIRGAERLTFDPQTGEVREPLRAKALTPASEPPPAPSQAAIDSHHQIAHHMRLERELIGCADLSDLATVWSRVNAEAKAGGITKAQRAELSAVKDRVKDRVKRSLDEMAQAAREMAQAAREAEDEHANDVGDADPAGLT